jgi:hypothetical protein
VVPKFSAIGIVPLFLNCYSAAMINWRTTFLAIGRSLWPQKKGDQGGTPPLAAGACALSLLRTALADPVTCLDHGGQLQFSIPGCHSLAAPFILFRLKRCGFSTCRVIHENGGLTVSARR